MHICYCVFFCIFFKVEQEILYSRSPLYSVEVMDEAIEPFSQSRSMFLLEVLLRTGKDSMEHTEAALCGHVTSVR